MLLLKSPRDRVASNIAITEKKKKQKNKSDISYMSAELWDNITNFKAYSVVQCEVPAVKNTSLVDDDNDDSK